MIQIIEYPFKISFKYFIYFLQFLVVKYLLGWYKVCYFIITLHIFANIKHKHWKTPDALSFFSPKIILDQFK